LNFPEQGGVTGYFSRNMTKSDLALVKEFLDSRKIYVLNTRAFKKGDKYIITVGSISKLGTQKDIDFKGNKFDINYGEFAPYLEECNYYLK
jgi:dipeptidyl-peptidase-3